LVATLVNLEGVGLKEDDVFIWQRCNLKDSFVRIREDED